MMADKPTVPRNKAGRTAFEQKVYTAAKRSGNVKKNGEPTKKALQDANRRLMQRTAAAGRAAKKASAATRVTTTTPRKKKKATAKRRG